MIAIFTIVFVLVVFVYAAVILLLLPLPSSLVIIVVVFSHPRHHLPCTIESSLSILYHKIISYSVIPTISYIVSQRIGSQFSPFWFVWSKTSVNQHNQRLTLCSIVIDAHHCCFFDDSIHHIVLPLFYM